MKKITSRAMIVVMGMAVAMLSGCGGKDEELPQEFLSVSAQFKAAIAGADKIALGKKLKGVLPTSRKGNVFDYNNPSYNLSKDLVREHMGQPNEVDENGTYIYGLGVEEKADRFGIKRKTYYDLMIEFMNGKVVVTRITPEGEVDRERRLKRKAAEAAL